MKILFTVPKQISSFIKKDLDLFKRNFDVETIAITQKNFLFKLHELKKKIKQADVTFSYFAGLRTALTIFFSKKLRKPSVIMLGGFETAYLPKFRYGALTSPLKRTFSRYCIKNASKVMVVNDFMADEIKKDMGIKRDVVVIYNGFDSKVWFPKGKKKNIILMVALASKINRAKLKGLDTFVQTARHLPKTKFIAIGISKKALKYLNRLKPSNVELVGAVKKSQLLGHYQKAKVYCQLSRREGFCNSVAEAMLCECVPVGTEAVSTVISNTGFFVPFRNAKATAEAIRKALRSNKGKAARERIKKNFPIKKREKELIEIIRKFKKTRNNYSTMIKI